MVNREHVRNLLARADSARASLPNPGMGDLAGGMQAEATTTVPAAVLVGLVAYPEGPRVILTERTAHLRDHAGQISFPGGRIEPSDESPEAAALREAAEETGLPPHRVEILGRLRPYVTITGFHVHPIVGWIEPPVAYTPDPFEVSEVFEVPLSFVLDTSNHRQEHYEAEGRTGSFYVLDFSGHHIWGATAGMLVELARVLRA